MVLDRHDHEDDEKTAAVIDATMRLAAHALDGAGFADEELDALCDAALSGTTAERNNPGKATSEDEGRLGRRR